MGVTGLSLSIEFDFRHFQILIESQGHRETREAAEFKVTEDQKRNAALKNFRSFGSTKVLLPKMARIVRLNLKVH